MSAPSYAVSMRENEFGNAVPMMKITCPLEFTSREKLAHLFRTAARVYETTDPGERWTVRVDQGRMAILIDLDHGSPSEAKGALAALRRCAGPEK